MGRRTECATLDALVGAIRRGESRALVIGGEAGIGKTGLLEYLVSRASNCRVARIVAIQSEAELAFAALHQLCAPMLERLDRLPEPQRNALEAVFGIRNGPAPDRLMVGLAVLSLLAENAEEQPLLCVVDDAHWLDHASAQALGFAARRLVAESVAVVFAHRTSEAAPDLENLPKLPVGGLDDLSAAALLRSVLPVLLDDQVRDRVIAETQGNPLAILELPRGLTYAELASGLLMPDRRGFVDQLEASFDRRVRSLPAETQQLLLIAAAESIGDYGVVRRAAHRLDIGPNAAAAATAAGLWEFGATVRFRHPLVRSAVYRGASVDERRIVHAALAEATSAPDRRAWHRAQAATAADEELAAELERSAARAQQRGGFAQSAAFLHLATRMTADPVTRAQRELDTARAECLAGDLEAALTALAAAQAGSLNALGRMQATLVSAQIAFALNRGGDGALLLLDGAKQAESLDPALARDTYLDALMAATWAGGSDGGGVDLREFAEAAAAAPAAPQERPTDLMLDGLAKLVSEGYAAGAPVLHRAIVEYRRDRGPDAAPLPGLPLGFMVAGTLWDDESWNDLSQQYLDIVRSTGALSAVPVALDYHVYALVFAGELSAAGVLVEEASAVSEAIGQSVPPIGPIALSALQGRALENDALLAASIAAADAPGGALRIAIAQWASALMHNGLGQYERAMNAALAAMEYHQDLTSTYVWACIELIEAASHLGHQEVGADALESLAVTTQGSGTDWALAVEARSRALLSDPDEAEPFYREAIDRSGRTRNRPDLARAHLLYGEWLRRRRRRLHARDHLRTAHEMFTGMGMDGFADRASRELRATGATPRVRSVESTADLTAQEAQVARLAGEGLSNPEIATRLFVSPKTVEYHLRKVFAKLNLSSRKELRRALGETPERV